MLGFVTQNELVCLSYEQSGSINMVSLQGTVLSNLLTLQIYPLYVQDLNLAIAKTAISGNALTKTLSFPWTQLLHFRFD